MDKNLQVQELIGVYKNVRSMTKYFLSQLKDIDTSWSPVIEGTKLNSVEWMVGHLCWSEDFLILKSVGNTTSGLPWLDEYGIGSNPDDLKTRTPFGSLLDSLDKIHESALKVLSGLNDAQLDQNNFTDLEFGGDGSIRMAIIHAIRHEPMHSGQLTWIAKMKGLRTI